MDSIKAQDIIRHIFKDEDKGVAYVTGLSITDGVEVHNAWWDCFIGTVWYWF